MYTLPNIFGSIFEFLQNKEGFYNFLWNKHKGDIFMKKSD